RFFDHGQADAVFDTAARIQLLQLGEDGRLDTGRDLVEPDERGVPDEIKNALVVLHRTPTRDSIPRSARCSPPNQRKKMARAATASVIFPKIISTAPAIVWSIRAV